MPSCICPASTQPPEALLEKDSDWAAPILWRSEFRNEGAEFEVESSAVLELVRDSDCSAYDCEFIALAMKLDTKLVTMDKKLLRAFPKRAMALSAS